MVKLKKYIKFKETVKRNLKRRRQKKIQVIFSVKA